MALVVKQGVQLSNTVNSVVSQNINFLSPLGFRFTMTRTPNLNYFCSEASIPAISMNEINQTSPFVNNPFPGDKITYEPFTLRFRVDENLSNYLEIHDWLVGLGHPDNLDEQYKTIDAKGIKTDGSLIVLSSNQNPAFRIAFQDMFPLSLSGLPFNVGSTDVEYLEADATFRYRRFTVEKL